MAKTSFSSLGLKLKEEIKEIDINGKKIEVKQYLSIKDKNDIIELSIQFVDGAENSVINTLALDAIIHTFIVIYYTNITFTDKQKEDYYKLYDLLENNGVIDAVIEAIPEIEYNSIKDNAEAMLKLYNNYKKSISAALDKFLLMSSPEALEPLNETAKSIDMSKLQQIVDLANNTGFQYKG